MEKPHQTSAKDQDTDTQELDTTALDSLTGGSANQWGGGFRFNGPQASRFVPTSPEEGTRRPFLR